MNLKNTRSNDTFIKRVMSFLVLLSVAFFGIILPSFIHNFLIYETRLLFFAGESNLWIVFNSEGAHVFSFVLFMIFWGVAFGFAVYFMFFVPYQEKASKKHLLKIVFLLSGLPLLINFVFSVMSYSQLTKTDLRFRNITTLFQETQIPWTEVESANFTIRRYKTSISLTLNLKSGKTVELINPHLAASLLKNKLRIVGELLPHLRTRKIPVVTKIEIRKTEIDFYLKKYKIVDPPELN